MLSDLFGMAIGAAMAGMRPVFEVMFGDFMTLCMDQLVNQAAKVRYMSNGAATVPLVLRTTMGVGAGLGPQHSQGFHAWAAHVPGLKVVVPSDAADARVLMKAAIRDDDPVLFFEDRLLYAAKAQARDADERLPLGRGRILRAGRAEGQRPQVCADAAGERFAALHPLRRDRGVSRLPAHADHRLERGGTAGTGPGRRSRQAEELAVQDRRRAARPFGG